MSLYVISLENVGGSLSRLNEADKEVFFSEVKNLIKIIKWNQERFLQEKSTRRQLYNLNKKLDLDIDIEMNSGEDSDEEEIKGGQASSSSRRNNSVTSFVK